MILSITQGLKQATIAGWFYLWRNTFNFKHYNKYVIKKAFIFVLKGRKLDNEILKKKHETLTNPYVKQVQSVTRHSWSGTWYSTQFLLYTHSNVFQHPTLPSNKFQVKLCFISYRSPVAENTGIRFRDTVSLWWPSPVWSEYL